MLRQDADRGFLMVFTQNADSMLIFIQVLIIVSIPKPRGHVKLYGLRLYYLRDLAYSSYPIEC